MERGPSGEWESGPGADPGRARAVRQEVAALLNRHPPEAAWALASREILHPGDDFALHVAAFEQCYGPGSLTGDVPRPAWTPDPETVARANVTHAAAGLGLSSYPDFHRWSVEHRERYWELAIRRLGICFREPYGCVLDDSAPTRPRWLPAAFLNIVDSCFSAPPDSPAILYDDGAGRIEATSLEELRRGVARVANALREGGVLPGDAVAVILPMSARAVALYLGIIAAGAEVVSIADSFASAEIATRLRISSPKLVFTQDEVVRG
ncbi:MAG TPA: AMP-binding protein, partial [Armatimonadota bacterium]|nr:AMP-binding protein [Armatimonadota bacterium]